MVTLVDTCVLLDILVDDPKWADWSGRALADARDAGELAINPIIYAEVAAGFDTVESSDESLPVAVEAPAVAALYFYRSIFELSPWYPDPVTSALFAFLAAACGCILVIARPNEAGCSCTTDMRERSDAL